MPLPDMGRKQGVEHAGMCGERLQGDLPDAVVSIHQQEQARHEKRRSTDLAMPRLIISKIAPAERFAESNRLMEGQSHAASGDRINCARGVADQRDVLRGRAAQPNGPCRRAARRIRRLCVLQPFRQSWKARREIGEAGLIHSAEQRDAYISSRPTGVT